MNGPNDAIVILRELADQLEEERLTSKALHQTLAEAVAKLPDWVGAHDEAHGWWCRAKALILKLEEG